MFVITQGAAIDRFFDPHTKEPIAAYGWVEEKGEEARKYWVSPPEGETQFFKAEETAELGFYRAIRERRQERTESAKRRASAYA